MQGGRHAWAGGPLDIALSVALVVWGVAEAVSFESGFSTPVRVAFALAATVPLAVRAAAPIPVAAWALGVFLLDSVAILLPVDAVTPLPGIPVAAYAVAVYAQPLRFARLAALIAIPGVPAAVGAVARDAPVTVADLVSLTGAVAIAVLAGWFVRNRREAAIREARVAAANRRARDRGLRDDLLGQRARIAAELRAIVARSLGEMDALLGRARRVTRPERLREIAEAVQATAADAVGDMQRSLSVLRDGEREPSFQATHPVTVAAAVAAAAARGWRVELIERGDPAATSPGALIAAARVVEELLEGAAPDGTDALVARFAHRSSGLRARLSGRGPVPPALREASSRARLHVRAELHGGRVRTRRRAGGWAIAIKLPGTHGGSPSGVRIADAVVVALASGAVAADAFAGAAEGPGLVLVAGAALFVAPLSARRRAPLAVAIVLAAGHLAGVLGGWLPARPYSTGPLVVLGCYAVASYAVTRRRAAVGGAALAIATLAVVASGLGDSGAPTDLPIVAFLAAGAWATGWAARSTTGRALRLWAGEVRAAAEYPERVRAALEEERRQVARDLHDIVAHGVSLVGVLAGAAAALAAKDAERASATLATAADALAETRIELGRLTAVLPPDVEEAPPISLDGISELVERARRGGQDVELTCPAAIPVPPGVWVSAYRIVQEALTNVRKHAPGAPASVRVGIDGGALVVEIENAAVPTRAAGSGTRQGIAGMRERAQLLDGDLHAAPTGSGGFRVRARLPLPHAASAPSDR